MSRFFRAFLAFVSIVTIAAMAAATRGFEAEKSPLPEFGLGTVLVWKIEGPEYEKSFVARLASFKPDRFIEWEGEEGQGTVLMPESAVADAKGYEISSLFSNGRDKKTRNETTLWLSRRVFTELMGKKTARWNLNGVASKLSFIGEGSVSIEVNRNVTELPVIRAADDRNAEWSFLNLPENPLMVRYEVRNFRQSLASITTGAPDSLRWIKGRKLPEASSENPKIKACDRDESGLYTKVNEHFVEGGSVTQSLGFSEVALNKSALSLRAKRR